MVVRSRINVKKANKFTPYSKKPRKESSYFQNTQPQPQPQQQQQQQPPPLRN